MRAMDVISVKDLSYSYVEGEPVLNNISFNVMKGSFVSLIGRNGSGKSTILSQLTPFKGSFDSRKSLILPGKEGLKEIDIKHNGHLYKIKHIYGTPAMSFISEDGTELNENGGVRTFEEIVHDKLSVNDDYFKVGKIGSNCQNFIQFTTTQRKDYISTLIEPIQKYIDAHEIIAEKVRLDNNKLKQLALDFM